MAARTSIARSARLFSSPRALHTGIRPQWQRPALVLRAENVRLFSVTGRAQEKRYTEDHEWVELDTDGKTVTLGISEYAANALGDVVYVELPAIDLEAEAGEPIGSVESVKSASDILTPVSGKVVETNTALEEKPGTLNHEPEGKGWIAKIQITGGSLDDGSVKLLNAEEYKAFTEEASE